MLPRSATAPLARGPPSLELSNLDCAFPPFPTSKSRSATPTRDLDLKQPRANNNEYVRMHAEPSPLYAPLSPRRNGGGNVLQRMNTIAPGPFDVGSRGRRDENQGHEDGKQHKRTATATNSKDFTRPPSAGSGKNNFPRPSTAGSAISRKLSLASISGGPKSMLDRAEKPFSVEPALPRPVRPDGYAVSGSHRELPQREPPNQPLRLEKRSQTFPINQNRGHIGERTGPLPQRPSEPPPAHRNRRPTVSAASRPSLPDSSAHSQHVSYRSTPGEPSSQPHGDAPGIHTGSTSRGEAKFDYRLNDAPPVPIPNLAKDFSAGDSYHTPTESVSSSGSYGSDAKSGSSRSSPPLSDASTRPLTNSFNVDHVGNSRTDVHSSVDSLQSREINAPRSKEAPQSVSNPIHLRPMELLPEVDHKMETPESPMDPAIQGGRLSPFPLSSCHLPSSAPTQGPDLAPPPARRSTTTNKGNCRGCGELIRGKSVSSADGRLTGRYHKQCFVCKTCKEPFQTADFYVLNNHPYCERHYHQLNGSLCRACDRGIEGQYLATESRQKFHPNCFTCQVRTHACGIVPRQTPTNRLLRIAAQSSRTTILR